MKRNKLSIELEFDCAECGEPLEVRETNLAISVEPCEKCLDKAFIAGKEKDNLT